MVIDIDLACSPTPYDRIRRTICIAEGSEEEAHAEDWTWLLYPGLPKDDFGNIASDRRHSICEAPNTLSWDLKLDLSTLGVCRQMYELGKAYPSDHEHILVQ